ncbi:ABC transporter ATP-binding protein [Palleronia pelagia]|uniref:Amino acid/amide ABC transporter ATP-binding protein 2, HAAT family n=1 Tax=Palleronia pelagia TaxID=387096 RepID=A0A1H8LMI7_9RHOB|nr:ABC transporter ATP-binding protein [Palleronia pelagia]SEO06412.1 amino acid/amide ABC transporter ATP-binding protein 2, HAAT family [Palleronia pelagia]
MTEPLLDVKDLHGWYGESHVLHGVSLSVQAGETVALIGRNGAGKTTTLRAIMNLLSRREGQIRFSGRDIMGVPRHRVAYEGLGFVPEERGIFHSLSVTENLRLLPQTGPDGMRDDDIYRFFPNLKERGRAGGGTLSGGEQQMLAIARVLRTGSKLLLLDEPTEGLAPVIVQRIAEMLRALKDSGMTMLLVEQNFHFAKSLADRFFLIENGQIAGSFARDEFDAHASAITEVVGV